MRNIDWINFKKKSTHGQWQETPSNATCSSRMLDQTWSSKEDMMDWFYPVLAGVIRKEKALKRINQRWDEFVETAGCRCVSDQPWVTVVETCELVMALNCIGDRVESRDIIQLVESIQGSRFGSYWTAMFFPRKSWPRSDRLGRREHFISSGRLTKKTRGSLYFHMLPKTRPLQDCQRLTYPSQQISPMIMLAS